MSTARAAELQADRAEQRQPGEPELWERAPEYSSDRDGQAEAAEAALFEALAH